MNPNLSISPRQATLVFLALALASGVGVALVAARFVVSHQFAYFNLVWNIFLAWLPLGFALLAGRFRGSGEQREGVPLHGQRLKPPIL